MINEDKKIKKIRPVNNVNNWTDNSLLKEIINDLTEYDEIEKDQLKQFLEKNFLKTVKQLKDLTEEQKQKYPDGLQNILNNVSGKTIKN